MFTGARISWCLAVVAVFSKGFFFKVLVFFFSTVGISETKWNNFPCPQQFLRCAKNMLTFLIQAQTSRYSERYH